MYVRVKNTTDSSLKIDPKDFGDSGFSIGRDSSCGVVLPNNFIYPFHAKVEKEERGWVLSVAPGASPVLVRRPDEQPVIAESGDTPLLFPTLRHVELELVDVFHLSLDLDRAEDESGEEINALLRDIQSRLLKTLELRMKVLQLEIHEPQARRRGEFETPEVNPRLLREVDTIIDDLIGGNSEFSERIMLDLTRRDLIVRALKVRLDDRILTARGIAKSSVPRPQESMGDEESIQQLLSRFSEELGISAGGADVNLELEKVERLSSMHAEDFESNTPVGVQYYLISMYIKKLLYDISFGLGPLSDLLRIPRVRDILVVKPTLIYLDCDGKMLKTNATFFDDDAALSVIEKIVSPVGRRADHSQPLVDARLTGGSRVNAVISPVAIKGPCITIRRFPETSLTARDLVENGTLTKAGLLLLEAFVKAKANIVVAGGTGSGKTTLLNILTGLIPVSERLVTIEDAAELRLPGTHVVSLESKPPNADEKGGVTIRDLVRNALRMRPDRIIVGECRGGETLDMLQAMNTGHPGSLSTVHANRVEDVAQRLETLVISNVDMPLAAIRRQISQAVNVIIFVERNEQKYLISEIAEVVGLHRKTGEVETRAVMAVSRSARGPGQQLVLRPTGYMPSFLNRIVSDGDFDLKGWFEECGR